MAGRIVYVSSLRPSGKEVTGRLCHHCFQPRLVSARLPVLRETDQTHFCPARVMRAVAFHHRSLCPGRTARGESSGSTSELPALRGLRPLRLAASWGQHGLGERRRSLEVDRLGAKPPWQVGIGWQCPPMDLWGPAGTSTHGSPCALLFSTPSSAAASSVGLCLHLPLAAEDTGQLAGPEPAPLSRTSQSLPEGPSEPHYLARTEGGAPPPILRKGKMHPRR